LQGKPEQVTTGQSGKIGIENYQPLDLPSDFQILNSFGKKVNQALDEFSEPGSVPHDIVRKIVRQVTEHIEAENPRLSMKTVEWVAWSYFMKFPGLKQVNPMETLKQSNQAAVGMVGMPFKEWVSNKTVFETININNEVVLHVCKELMILFFLLRVCYTVY